MGHRLIALLAYLNALGLLSCVILTAAAISRDPAAAITIAQALQLSVRMFVVGCALPAVAWAISAMELNRANDRVRKLESWAMYFLLLVSLGLFFIGSWRVPDSLLAGVS